MAILTSLLLITAVLGLIYISYLRNTEAYKKVFALFPSFKKGVDAHHGGHSDHGDHGDHGAHHGSEHDHHPAPVVPILSATVKVVVYVPDAHADAVRQAIGEAGAGRIGNYSFCTFSSLGIGRYLPGPGANPMVGTVGVHEKVEEERIEFTCDRENLRNVVQTIKKVHPYEEIIIDIYPLEADPAGSSVTAH